ncbi:MAG: hypothetical protein Q9206_001498, partial [Seirophora lacunosa]
RCLAAATTACGPVFPVQWVQNTSEDVVHAVHCGHGLRDIGFAMDNCASGEQQFDQRRGGGRRMERKGGNANGGIVTFDREDREAMEGAERSGAAGEMLVEEAGAGKGRVKEGFGEGVEELYLAESSSDLYGSELPIADGCCETSGVIVLGDMKLSRQ